jgi:hypothetical protein
VVPVWRLDTGGDEAAIVAVDVLEDEDWDAEEEDEVDPSSTVML